MEASGFAEIEIQAHHHEIMFPRDKFVELVINNNILKANVPDEEKRARIAEAGAQILASQYGAEVKEIKFDGTAGVVVAKKL